MSEPLQQSVAPAHTRQCPSTNGAHPPLITHNIGAQACLTRQRELYHKCYRCVYRGHSASFVIEARETKKS